MLRQSLSEAPDCFMPVPELSWIVRATCDEARWLMCHKYLVAVPDAVHVEPEIGKLEHVHVVS